MTKSSFLTAVANDTNFRSWAVVPAAFEEAGTIQKWRGIAYIKTPDGANLTDVWFIWDSVADVAEWQNGNGLSPEKNINSVKFSALKAYLKGKYAAFFIGNMDFDNNWAQATVYSLTSGKLTKKDIIVYQTGNSPIADLDVI